MDDINVIKLALWLIAGLLSVLCGLLVYIWNDRKSVYKADRQEQKDFNQMVSQNLTKLQNESTAASAKLTTTIEQVKVLFGKHKELNGKVVQTEKDIVHLKTKASKH